MSIAPSAQEVARVARQLWGDPNDRQSKPAELRFGKHGSKSVDLEKLTWFDHEARSGGGWRELWQLAGEPLPARDANIGAIYDYHAEGGRLLFQVVRRPNHKFYQRRPGTELLPVAVIAACAGR